jgi:hypothetical protein
MSTVATLHTAGGYEAVKAIALKNQPLVMKANWKELEVDNNGELSVRGIPVRSDSNKVQRQLLKQMGLSRSFYKKFGKLTNEETQKALIEVLKAGLSNKGNKEQLTVIGNPVQGIITGILGPKQDLISNTFSLQLLEEVLNKYPGLLMQNFEVDDNGDFSVNMKRPGEVTPRDMAGKLISGEEFNPGFTYRNSAMKGTEVMAFTERVVCTNGMTAQVLTAFLEMQKYGDASLEKFNTGLKHFSDNNFIQHDYFEKVNKAMNTPASFAEVLNARRYIKGYSSIKDDKDMDEFLPMFGSQIRAFAQKSIDYTKCTDRQLQNCPLKSTVWDVINCVTNFGSHDYGWKAEFSPLQRAAGRMLNRQHFDAEHLILMN